MSSQQVHVRQVPLLGGPLVGAVQARIVALSLQTPRNRCKTMTPSTWPLLTL
jgi:hypothetical protein